MTKQTDRRPDRYHTQEDLEDIILDILDSGSIMTTAQINRRVKSQINVFPDDMIQANKRSNETKLDQIISNTLNDTRSISKKGYIERTGVGEFRITELGKQYNEKRRNDLTDMLNIASNMNID